MIIPVRDAWRPLRRCLDALARQSAAPSFELIVVDDGSDPPLRDVLPPETWPVAGRLVRQTPLGVAAARNRGIAEARADLLVFVDADVVLDPAALRSFHRAAAEHPGDGVFQARLVGGRRFVSRMESLRLEAVQQLQQTPDGRIGYLNTSACALRRPATADDFFPVRAVRGEDTLVLARLTLAGARPRYVPAALARHEPPLPLPRYLWKHLAIGYHTAPARAALRAARGPLLSPRQRARMFGVLWRRAGSSGRDRAAALLVLGAFALEIVGRAASAALRRAHGRAALFSFGVDAVTAEEIICRVSHAVRERRGLCLTYLTAWTLAQANRDRQMPALLRGFDLCYADGMGVVAALLLLRGRRLRKVTANEFFAPLCRELALQGRTLALIGAEPGVVERARAVLTAAAPGLRVVLTADGYLDDAKRHRLRARLEAVRPDVVVLGMGQPRQEQWVMEHRALLPGSVFFCVGGLFDYLAQLKPTPPRFVRRLGFEWLFLLLTCPRRFGYRYCAGLPLLALDILRHHARAWRRPDRQGRCEAAEEEAALARVAER